MNAHIQVNSRRRIMLLIVSIAICMFLGSCSSKPKVYRVGILSGLDYLADVVEGFKVGMTELGYVEGQNIFYDLQKSNFDMDEYKSVLKKFITDKVDLIFVFPTEASLEAKAAAKSTNIPVLFNFALIEGMGLVNSVREPGGNITGVRYPGPDLATKRFEIMCRIAPNAKRMLIPYQKGYPIVPVQLEALRLAATSVGITLEECPASGAAELKAILDTRSKSKNIGIDAILFLAEPLAVTPDAFEVMGKFAYNHTLPIGGALMTVGDYSSIFGVNVNMFNSGKQAAPIANKILKGTPAGTIPVISAESYLEINYKAAQQLGVTVSEGLLSMAEKVIR